MTVGGKNKIHRNHLMLAVNARLGNLRSRYAMRVTYSPLLSHWPGMLKIIRFLAANL